MSELNPTNGYFVQGVKLDENRFIGRMKGSQLLRIADDPRNTEKEKMRVGNTHLEALYELRKDVQRLFEGAKRANVEPYAKYIVGIHEKHLDGMTPAIILYSAMPLEMDDQAILIPWDAQIVAIDGETQLAGRFEAANINPDTKNDFVAVLICHGKDKEWARQVFHDLNLLAVKPNAAVAIGMDQRDPLTHVARIVEEKVPFFTGRVNTVRRQLKAKDKEIVTITTLRGACVTLSEGIGGVKYGAKPVHVEESRIPGITDVAVEWFGAVADLLGPVLADRIDRVPSSASVFTAIGAMGNALLTTPLPQRAAKKAQLLEQLRTVNWAKGEHWAGVCGKYTPSGTFSIGGPKEVAHAVYSALMVPSDPAYSKIRAAVAVPVA
jgi:hypothetical protein